MCGGLHRCHYYCSCRKFTHVIAPRVCQIPQNFKPRSISQHFLNTNFRSVSQLQEVVQLQETPHIQKDPEVKEVPEVKKVPELKEVPEIKEVPEVKGSPEVKEVPGIQIGSKVPRPNKTKGSVALKSQEFKSSEPNAYSRQKAGCPKKPITSEKKPNKSSMIPNIPTPKRKVSVDTQNPIINYKAPESPEPNGSPKHAITPANSVVKRMSSNWSFNGKMDTRANSFQESFSRRTSYNIPLRVNPANVGAYRPRLSRDQPLYPYSSDSSIMMPPPKGKKMTQKILEPKYRRPIRNPKPEPEKIDELALVKAKPKRIIKRPVARKLPEKIPLKESGGTIPQVTTDEKGIWLECKLPFRVNIPFPVCLQNLLGFPPNSSTIPGNPQPCKGNILVTAGQIEQGNLSSGFIPARPALPSSGSDSISGKVTSTKKKSLKRGKTSCPCETSTQTIEEDENPVLSCLEQIRDKLPNKTPEVLEMKPECRCFAEKSTNVTIAANGWREMCPGHNKFIYISPESEQYDEMDCALRVDRCVPISHSASMTLIDLRPSAKSDWMVNSEPTLVVNDRSYPLGSTERMEQEVFQPTNYQMSGCPRQAQLQNPENSQNQQYMNRKPGPDEQRENNTNEMACSKRYHTSGESISLSGGGTPRAQENFQNTPKTTPSCGQAPSNVYKIKSLPETTRSIMKPASRQSVEKKSSMNKKNSIKCITFLESKSKESDIHKGKTSEDSTDDKYGPHKESSKRLCRNRSMFQPNANTNSKQSTHKIFQTESKRSFINSDITDNTSDGSKSFRESISTLIKHTPQGVSHFSKRPKSVQPPTQPKKRPLKDLKEKRSFKRKITKKLKRQDSDRVSSGGENIATSDSIYSGHKYEQNATETSSNYSRLTSRKSFKGYSKGTPQKYSDELSETSQQIEQAMASNYKINSQTKCNDNEFNDRLYREDSDRENPRNNQEFTSDRSYSSFERSQNKEEPQSNVETKMDIQMPINKPENKFENPKERISNQHQMARKAYDSPATGTEMSLKKNIFVIQGKQRSQSAPANSRSRNPFRCQNYPNPNFTSNNRKPKTFPQPPQSPETVFVIQDETPDSESDFIDPPARFQPQYQLQGYPNCNTCNPNTMNRENNSHEFCECETSGYSINGDGNCCVIHPEDKIIYPRCMENNVVEIRDSRMMVPFPVDIRESENISPTEQLKGIPQQLATVSSKQNPRSASGEDASRPGTRSGKSSKRRSTQYRGISKQTSVSQGKGRNVSISPQSSSRSKSPPTIRNPKNPIIVPATSRTQKQSVPLVSQSQKQSRSSRSPPRSTTRNGKGKQQSTHQEKALSRKPKERSKPTYSDSEEYPSSPALREHKKEVRGSVGNNRSQSYTRKSRVKSPSPNGNKNKPEKDQLRKHEYKVSCTDSYCRFSLDGDVKSVPKEQPRQPESYNQFDCRYVAQPGFKRTPFPVDSGENAQYVAPCNCGCQPQPGFGRTPHPVDSGKNSGYVAPCQCGCQSQPGFGRTPQPVNSWENSRYVGHCECGCQPHSGLERTPQPVDSWENSGYVAPCNCGCQPQPGFKPHAVESWKNSQYVPICDFRSVSQQGLERTPHPVDNCRCEPQPGLEMAPHPVDSWGSSRYVASCEPHCSSLSNPRNQKKSQFELNCSLASTNVETLETVTIMQPRKLRSTDSTRIRDKDEIRNPRRLPSTDSTKIKDQGGIRNPEFCTNSTEFSAAMPYFDKENLLQICSQPPKSFRNHQYAGVPPCLKQGIMNHTMASPSQDRSTFSQNNRIDSRDHLRNVQKPISAPIMEQRSREGSDLGLIPCEYPCTSSETNRQNVKMMPQEIYEAILLKYNVTRMDSDFRPPALRPQMLQALELTLPYTGARISPCQQQTMRSTPDCFYRQQNQIQGQLHSDSVNFYRQQSIMLDGIDHLEFQI